MTSCLRVLTSASLDSSPSLLLVSPDGSKVLINCGEGCQRAFIEYGQKVATVQAVCLTQLNHDAVGGLPGFLLTASDIHALHSNSSNQGKNGGVAGTTTTTTTIVEENEILVQDDDDEPAQQGSNTLALQQRKKSKKTSLVRSLQTSCPNRNADAREHSPSSRCL